MEFDFLQNSASGTDTDVYTFATQNLGTAAANRYILVSVAARTLAGSALSSITVAGETASLAVNHAPGNGSIAAIGVAAVPSGTTGDIVLTFNGTMRRAGYAAYRITGLSSVTPNSTDTGSSDPDTLTVTVPDPGFAVAIASDATDGSATYTWSGLGVFEDFDAVLEAANANYSGAQSETAGSVGFEVSHNQASAIPATAAASFALAADAAFTPQVAWFT